MKHHPVKGSSTFELLIAFAILTLTLTAVISVLFGNQSVAVDTETSAMGIAKASAALESARALAKNDFAGASTTAATTESMGPLSYTKTMSVAELTPCKKQATSTVSWSVGTFRPLKIELATYLTDIAGALKMGGDCFADAPLSGWTNPSRFASDTLSPGKPTALDVLDGIAYLGLDKSPYLAIADTRSAVKNQTNGLFVTFAPAPALSNEINSLDAVRWIDPVTGAAKQYVFAAMNRTTNQLVVMDVTTRTAPTITATRAFSSCVTGSFPQGWYVYAYGGRLYAVVRETAGPEFHIFDISTPANPTEFSTGNASCRGFELTDTVEQMMVRDQVVAGVTKRYAYLVTDESNKEIRILDVTNPLAITEVRSVDLPGTQDAMSLYVTGSRLYVGRQSVSTGPELYIYDAYQPASSLPLLGTREIGTSVLGIRVASSLAFIATSKTNQEFQVWNVKNPSSISNVAVYNFGNVVGQGIDYEPDFIYATGQSTPNFQMLYSP